MHRVERRDCSLVRFRGDWPEGLDRRAPVELEEPLSWRIQLYGRSTQRVVSSAPLARLVAGFGGCAAPSKSLSSTRCASMTTARGTPPHCPCYGSFSREKHLRGQSPQKTRCPKKEFLATWLNSEEAGGPPRYSCPAFSRERSDLVYREMRGSERQSPGVKGFFNGLEKYMDSRYG